jgi:hypothetical protein
VAFLIRWLLILFFLPASFQSSGRSPFGVIDDSPTDPAILRELGVGWQQIPFSWASLQPDGSDSFEPLDLPSRREIVGLITETPTWASESGAANAVPDGLYLPVDDPANVWAVFITHLVTIYAPQGVHHWVIYDEPDVRLGEGRVQFAGDVDDYAQMLRIASVAAKAVDSDAMIHIGALNWWNDVAAGREHYLARLIRASDAIYFDVVTLRVLVGTESAAAMLDSVRQILPATPIWLEINIRPTLDPLTPVESPLFAITPQMQSDYLVQASALALAAGVERIGIYDLTGDTMGLIRDDGSRRPAFETYQTVIDLFSATTIATRYSSNAAEMIVLEQANQAVYILWARGTTPVNFSVSSPVIGETAHLGSHTIRSQDTGFPPTFTLSAESRQPDAHGFLPVSGSPLILVLDNTDDFFRVVYVEVNGARARLK